MITGIHSDAHGYAEIGFPYLPISREAILATPGLRLHPILLPEMPRILDLAAPEPTVRHAAHLG